MSEGPKSESRSSTAIESQHLASITSAVATTTTTTCSCALARDCPSYLMARVQFGPHCRHTHTMANIQYNSSLLPLLASQLRAATATTTDSLLFSRRNWQVRVSWHSRASRTPCQRDSACVSRRVCSRAQQVSPRLPRHDGAIRLHAFQRALQRSLNCACACKARPNVSVCVCVQKQH